MAGERVADQRLLDGKRPIDRARREGVDDRPGSAEVGKGSDFVFSCCWCFLEILRPQGTFSARRKRNLSGGESASPTWQR